MKPAVLKKWIPAVLAPAVVAAFALGASFSANAQVQLEPKTPQQVLQMIAGSRVTDFSGTARATLNLGIPQLPDPGSTGMMQQPGASGAEGEAESDGVPAKAGADLLGMLSALSGTHEARVYVDGPDKARIQVMDGMDEQNFIRNGSSLWHYDSAENTAVHLTLPRLPRHAGPPRHTMQPPTPGVVADRLLEAMGPNTDLSVQDDTRVAGRDAYTLELVPRSDESLIAKVSIGVDAATGAPLDVVVDAVGQEDPAIAVGFTTFTPETPAADLFEFTPPPGAEVSEHKIPKRSLDHKPGHNPGAKANGHNPGAKANGHNPGAKANGHKIPKPFLEHKSGAKDGTGKPGNKRPAGHPDAIKGTGWDTVLVVPAKEVPKELAANELLNQLATPVEGGKLLHTSLLNVLITDDGRLVMGSVTVERLQAVASGQ
ncbi:outer membrane lipoprotein carrier protein LolA [Paeniglutamicibacter sp. MACA_103]|uniref:LolA family protein n=1 Tax=Paeniglutamicibacter sp. MACA_103 TaxID=3377337 RepID=UPI003894A9DB